MTSEDVTGLMALDLAIGDIWGVFVPETGEKEPADIAWVAVVALRDFPAAFLRFVVRRRKDGPEPFALVLWENPDGPRDRLSAPTLAHVGAVVLRLRDGLRDHSAQRTVAVPTSDAVH